MTGRRRPVRARPCTQSAGKQKESIWRTVSRKGHSRVVHGPRTECKSDKDPVFQWFVVSTAGTAKTCRSGIPVFRTRIPTSRSFLAPRLAPPAVVGLARNRERRNRCRRHDAGFREGNGAGRRRLGPRVRGRSALGPREPDALGSGATRTEDAESSGAPGTGRPNSGSRRGYGRSGRARQRVRLATSVASYRRAPSSRRP